MTFKTLVSAFALSMAVIGTAQAAATDTVPGDWGSFTANLGVVSDYRFRGITQSDEHPAVQGGIDWSHNSGLYLGAWASNVDFNDHDTHIETDIYGGYKVESNDLSLDVGLLGYLYPDADRDRNYDYMEVKVAGGYAIGGGNIGASINYSPNNFGDTGNAVYVGLTGDAPIADTGFNVTGSIGRQWIDEEAAFGAPDYNDWSLGVGYDWQGFNLSAKYIDTNADGSICPDNCDGTVGVGISRSFP